MRIFALIVSLFASIAVAGEAQLSWTFPTQNTDGTTIPASGDGSLTDTVIEWGSCSGGAFDVKAGEFAVSVPTNTYTVPNLAPATHCFRAKVTNTYGVVSDWSGTVNKVIAPPKPNPPVLLVIDTMAYELTDNPAQGIRLGRLVGTVPVGTVCGDTPLAYTERGAYYEVSLADVALTKMPKSAVVVARCITLG